VPRNQPGGLSVCFRRIDGDSRCGNYCKQRGRQRRGGGKLVQPSLETTIILTEACADRKIGVSLIRTCGACRGRVYSYFYNDGQRVLHPLPTWVRLPLSTGVQYLQVHCASDFGMGGSNVVIEGGEFSRNNALEGGAVMAQGASLTVTGGLFRNNFAR